MSTRTLSLLPSSAQLFRSPLPHLSRRSLSRSAPALAARRFLPRPSSGSRTLSYSTSPPNEMAPAFTLFTHPSTPNGMKLAVFLEELRGAYPRTFPEYKTQVMALWRGEHKAGWYLKINPNGKVPALVHHLPNGKDHSVFESTAMMVYLCEHFDPMYKLSFPPGSDYASECMQWTLWGHGELGPIQGIAGNMLSRPTVELLYPIKRYVGKTQRMYKMLNDRLEGRDWLVGAGRGMLSVADLAIYPWIMGHDWAGLETLDAYPNVKRWKKLINERPAVRRVRERDD